MPWKQFAAENLGWLMSLLAIVKGNPIVLALTMRRRSDDDHPMPAWMTQAVKLAMPFIVSALSAYGATMIALSKSDAVKTEQIKALQDADQRNREDAKEAIADIKRDVNDRLRAIEMQHAQLLSAQGEILRYIQQRESRR